MDLIFILAQVFGVIAWFLLAISYYRENTKRILYVQLLSMFFYSLNYLFLGAFVGIIVILIELIRDYAYYKTDKANLIFLCSIPFYLLLAYFARGNLIWLLPIIAGAFEGFTLTKKKYVVVTGALLVYTLWIIYDIAVMSYTGAVTDAMIVGSNLFIIIGYIIRVKRIKDFKVISNHHIDKDTFESIYSLDKSNYDKKILWDSKYQEDLYNRNKASFTFIKYKNEILGYVNYLVLDKEEFNEIVTLSNLKINYDKEDILTYKLDSDNYVIIDSIVINPDYENKKAVKLFANAIKDYFKTILKQGYKISDIIAVGVTDFEKDVLKACSFEEVKKLQHKHILYMYNKKGS